MFKLEARTKAKHYANISSSYADASAFSVAWQCNSQSGDTQHGSNGNATDLKNTIFLTDFFFL